MSVARGQARAQEPERERGQGQGQGQDQGLDRLPAQDCGWNRARGQWWAAAAPLTPTPATWRPGAAAGAGEGESSARRPARRRPLEAPAARGQAVAAQGRQSPCAPRATSLHRRCSGLRRTASTTRSQSCRQAVAVVARGTCAEGQGKGQGREGKTPTEVMAAAKRDATEDPGLVVEFHKKPQNYNSQKRKKTNTRTRRHRTTCRCARQLRGATWSSGQT